MVSFLDNPSKLHNNKLIEDLTLGWCVILNILVRKGGRGGGVVHHFY